jgi:preprotein translocase subunit SecY
MAFLNGLGQATILTQASSAAGPVLANFGFGGGNWLGTLATLVTLTAGTMFAIWLGQLIDDQGIGNGLSIIILGGILAGIPQRLGQLWVTSPWSLLVFAVVTVVTVVGIVLVHEGQRRVPVQYAKRVRGNRVFGGQSTHIPLQLNSAGMIPLIFAVSLIMLPGVVSSYFVGSNVKWVADAASWMTRAFSSEGWFYWLLYFVLVVGFTYFYTDVIFQQQNLPETLQKQGGFIPGIRPGTRTAEFLHGVVQRITLVGALFLGVIAILPFLVRPLVGAQSQMLLTSTGLLIVVGVILDTMKQLEAQLLMRHYEGFIRKMR